MQRVDLPVQRGTLERRVPTPSADVDVGSGLEEPLHDFGVAFPGGMSEHRSRG